MTPVLRLAALGSEVEVQCTGESADLLAVHMREAWSRCLAPGDANSTHPVEMLEARLDDSSGLAQRLMHTTQEITRALIGAQAGRLLMLHAGAVSHPETGASVVYVAAGGTGKTTLSRRLGRTLGYLTDETVGIEEAGTILPYTKPLSVRRPSGLGPKDEVSPDSLGLLPAPPRPHAARVVLLDRQPDSIRPQVDELTFMDALFALTEQTSSLPRLRSPLHRLGSLIDTCGPVLRLRYAEAADIEHQLSQLVGGAE